MDFQTELAELIKKHGLANSMETPAFVLARYIRGCLSAFEMAVSEREQGTDEEGSGD